MSEKQADYQAHSDIRTLPWTVEKCGDIKRALSGRVHNARREHALSVDEMADMASLYLAVHSVDEMLRRRYGLTDPPLFPEWVADDVLGL